MDLSLFPALGLGTVALCLVVASCAGVVKGMVGFAMPLILVSGMSTFIDPKLALGALILPTVATNLRQTLRQGLPQALDAIREFWRYLLIVCVMIFITAQGVAAIPSRVFFGVLGVPVLGLSLMQLAGLRLSIPAERRVVSQWLFGGVSGIFGGIAGTWGPLTVLYLLAIEVPKQRQMVVQGVIYGIGSLVLFAAHLQSGLLNTQTAPFSALLVIPALLGMQIGFRLQDRMDQDRFRQITLILLVVAGLNLIRRAVLG